MKYFIGIIILILLCSCSTVKGFKKNDDRIAVPKKAKIDNRFIRSADEKANPEKQVMTPEGFTKWTIFTSAGSFLLFQFLKWKQVV